MKIIEMQRLTYNELPVYEEEGNTRDWWCVIETEEEAKALEDFEKDLGEYGGDMREVEWNKRMIEAGKDFGLCWGDDDVYGYLMLDEDHPEVGEETMDGDGDIWVRTK